MPSIIQDSPSTCPYRYEPLPPGEYIRYIHLDPGQQEDSLTAGLHSTSLANAPPIEAVSYVWHSRERNVPLTVNGSNLLITKSLQDVLIQVRSPISPRSLWADSICIDQNNTLEKSQQVSFMGRIYNSAQRVLICLGVDQEYIPAAEAARSLVVWASDTIRKTAQSVTGWDSYPYVDADGSILSDSRWDAISVLLSQPWFQRGWTVQESALARQATILWGRNAMELDWLRLVRTCIWARRDPRLRARLGLNLSIIHISRYMRQQGSDDDAESSKFATREEYERCCVGINHLDVLNHGRRYKLTDPRDHVYAFLSLMDICTRMPEIEVDYQKSYEDICFDVAAEYVSSSGDLGVLHYIEHNEQSLADSKIASWIPQWGQSLYQTRITNTFSRTKIIRSVSRHTIQPCIRNGSQLSTAAAVFDTVHFVSEELYQESTDIGTIASIWSSLANQPGTSYHAISPLVAFLCVLWPSDQVILSNKDFRAHACAYALHLHRSAATPHLSATDLAALQEASTDGDPLFFHEMIRTRLLHGRKLFSTTRGLLGLGPGPVREGDVCAVVFGGTQVPFVLRPADGNLYRVLGEACITSPVLGDGGEIRWLGFAQEWVHWGVKEEDIVLC